MSDTPKMFVQSLFGSDEIAVDSIVVGGLLALLGLLVFTGTALYFDPKSFNPMSYAGGAAGLVAAIGGGRRLRDGSQ